MGFAEARILEPLVFLVIVWDAVLQGGSAKWFGQRLGVAEAEPQGFLLMANRFGRLLAEAIQQEGFVVRLVDNRQWKMCAWPAWVVWMPIMAMRSPSIQRNTFPCRALVACLP